MKAWGRLLAAAGAVLIVLASAAGASAASRAHRRHVQVFPASNDALLYLGEHDGYEIGVSFKEPDNAILFVETVDQERQAYTSTAYGAHFRGSLPFGRLRAHFGHVGSIAVRFRPEGKVRSGRNGGRCTGRRPREESGSFVGRVSLRGEDDYFHLASRRGHGYLERSFRLRCFVKHHRPTYPPESLREAVEPSLSFSAGSNGGSLATLEVAAREGHRRIALRAAHMQGAPPGAEVHAITFEYQGKMPVGRSAEASQAPAGTLLSTLPGERPATASLAPPAPFSGEGRYVGTSPTSHSWTGTLAVQFPGLLQPLAGPEFASTFCVVSPLVERYGCDFQLPDWQWAEG